MERWMSACVCYLSESGVGPLTWLRMSRKSGLTVRVWGRFTLPTHIPINNNNKKEQGQMNLWGKTARWIGWACAKKQWRFEIHEIIDTDMITDDNGDDGEWYRRVMRNSGMMGKRNWTFALSHWGDCEKAAWICIIGAFYFDPRRLIT